MAGASVFVAVIAFLAWAVYMGALASIQSACPDINNSNQVNGIRWSEMGLGLGEECDSVLRYWWFIMSIEFALIVAVACAGIFNKLHTTRIALTAFAAVCMILFILASDTTLSMFLAIPTNVHAGYLYYRLRTLVAGCILVAALNGFLIIALGISDDYELKKREVDAEVEHKAHA